MDIYSKNVKVGRFFCSNSTQTKVLHHM